MIGQPPGWTRHPSGNRIMLFPPGGSALGGIRYDERKAPLVPLSKILAAHTQDEGFRVERVGTWERCLTIEGEYAATITIGGALAGTPVQRDLGVVVLDDSYAMLSGYCLSPDSFAEFASAVRNLTRGDVHMLGVRRRRFEYDRPAGWQARARSFSAEWFPPDYPHVDTSITVWPALPSRTLTAESFLERVVDSTSTPRERALITMHGEVRGRELVLDSTLDGRAITRRLIVLEDDRYIYPTQLEALAAIADEHTDRLRTLVRSIHPIPRPAQRDAHPLHPHWAD